MKYNFTEKHIITVGLSIVFIFKIHQADRIDPPLWALFGPRAVCLIALFYNFNAFQQKNTVC